MHKPSHRIAGTIINACLSDRPRGMPIKRPRGAKGAGLRYERLFAKALAERILEVKNWHVRAGQWFQFVDERGSSYCQPDVYLETRDRVYIFECKLTDTEQAQSQLNQLYLPVLQRALRKDVHGIVVTRHLTKTTETTAVVDNFISALQIAKAGIVMPIFHWRERNPL